MDKIEIIKAYLREVEGVSEEELESDVTEGYDSDTFEGNGAEYKVYTDDEADAAFYEQQQGLIDDLGLDLYSEDFKDYILSNCIDPDMLTQELQASFDTGDEDDEDNQNDLQAIEDDPLQFAADIDMDLTPFIDWDAVNEEVKSQDGRGPTIAGYDGEEVEFQFEGETYYIYRTN